MPRTKLLAAIIAPLLLANGYLTQNRPGNYIYGDSNYPWSNINDNVFYSGYFNTKGYS